MDDEILDLVTREDKVIGTINRSDYDKLASDNLGYIRACGLFIVNSKNEIFVPTRTAEKTIAPNGYDFSASGHVMAGESYENALTREVGEELSLDIDPRELELIAKTVHDDIHYIQSTYLLRSDITPTVNPSDFMHAEWLSIQDFTNALNSGHSAKDLLKPCVKLLNDHLCIHSTT